MIGPISVVGAGMVGSLGYDMRTACAAARAGLVRTSEVACRVGWDEREPGLATGHCVSGLTDGFEGDPRLARLVGQAFRDLFAQDAVDLEADCGWFVGIPSAKRRRTGLDRIAEPDAREAYERDLARLPAAPADSLRAERILRMGLQMAGRPISPDINHVTTAGQVGFAELFDAASRNLGEGRIEMAWIVCVDSLIAEPDVRWLSITQRLKSVDQPTGLAPGEAAVALLLTTKARAHRAGLTPMAHLHSLRRATGPGSFLTGEPADGKGLTSILGPLVEAQSAHNHIPWLVTDQNGESYRAADWGHAFVRMRAATPVYREANLWYPAMSFGDTAGATGAVSICVSLQAFARRYAPSDVATVVSSNDGPERAAVLVEDAKEAPNG